MPELCGLHLYERRRFERPIYPFVGRVGYETAPCHLQQIRCHFLHT